MMRDLKPFLNLHHKGMTLEQAFGIKPNQKVHVDRKFARLLSDTNNVLKIADDLWSDGDLPLNAKLFYIFQLGRFYQRRQHEEESAMVRLKHFLRSYNRR